MNIPPILRNRLIQAAGGGAFAIAAVLINWHEGRVYKPYVDPAGHVTVCEGHTGTDIIWGKTYSDEECDFFKEVDMRKAQWAVRRLVRVPLNKYQEAALIDFTFNLGPAKLATSTLLSKLNAGDYAGACAQYDRWNKARVRGILTILKGLVFRRDADRWVCEGMQ